MDWKIVDAGGREVTNAYDGFWLRREMGKLDESNLPPGYSLIASNGATVYRQPPLDDRPDYFVPTRVLVDRRLSDWARG